MSPEQQETAHFQEHIDSLIEVCEKGLMKDASDLEREKVGLAFSELSSIPDNERMTPAQGKSLVLGVLKSEIGLVLDVDSVVDKVIDGEIIYKDSSAEELMSDMPADQERYARILNKLGKFPARREIFMMEIVDNWTQSCIRMRNAGAEDKNIGILKAFLESPSSYSNLNFIQDTQIKILEKFDQLKSIEMEETKDSAIDFEDVIITKIIHQESLGRVMKGMVNGSKFLQDPDDEKKSDLFKKLYEELRKRGIVVVTSFELI